MHYIETLGSHLNKLSIYLKWSYKRGCNNASLFLLLMVSRTTLFLYCLVSDEYYDAFICYAKEDRSFANEILQKLEEKPYYRKVCIDFRDYVPGNCLLEQTAAIIEERCKKIVVLLSRHFENCENAGFQVKIALNLSPGNQSKSNLFKVYMK